ncbi:hypothetical protein Rsub_01616 [Raphidocelis subcapitata]|uniref:Uncharacterized protein n=1 Tax=Raphidocelis subcapitata TaxID=307507 RepID=A0A2V0NUU9_9CHLO|nr:hypothetical protein Rsub_01616 [Raphidocelis subcapitata]|eukprot:GBF88717.1 hypothetical protein Rsub_01616 [Raphidocelis subcapitata]
MHGAGRAATAHSGAHRPLTGAGAPRRTPPTRTAGPVAAAAASAVQAPAWRGRQSRWQQSESASRRRHTAAAAPPEGAAASHPAQEAPAAADAGEVDAAALLRDCRPHDILHARSAADGTDWWLEVLPPPPAAPAAKQQRARQGRHARQQPQPAAAASDGGGAAGPAAAASARVSSGGVLYEASAAEGGLLALAPIGPLLTPEDPTVASVPGWADQLRRDAAAAPFASAAPVLLEGARAVGSAEALEAQVAAEPALWCGGTAPGAPPLAGLASKTLCAGETAALLLGQRGVAMVQLHIGWDSSVPTPLHNPLALRGLRAALADAGVSAFVSRAPGGLGLSLILAARRAPFRQWGAHLASFGAQASLVADSPYYKLLIGRVLGYSHDNIVHHIRTTNGAGHPSAEVVAAVAAELSKLSPEQPALPWRSGKGGESGGDGGGGGGGAGGAGRAGRRGGARRR